MLEVDPYKLVLLTGSFQNGELVLWNLKSLSVLSKFDTGLCCLLAF